MNMEQIVITLSSMGLIRTARITGDYYQIYCPIHNDGNERKPSCGILLHDQYKAGKKYAAGWFLLVLPVYITLYAIIGRTKYGGNMETYTWI